MWTIDFREKKFKKPNNFYRYSRPFFFLTPSNSLASYSSTFWDTAMLAQVWFFKVGEMGVKS
jgi:hypothetical protein